MKPVRRLRGNQLLDIHRRDDSSAEFEHLQNAAGGQLSAAKPGGEADELFDARGAAGLATRTKAIEHECGKAFGRCVDGRRDAGRTSADDCQIDFLRWTMSPNARFAGELL